MPVSIRKCVYIFEAAPVTIHLFACFSFSFLFLFFFFLSFLFFLTEHPPVATGPNMARCQSCFGYISPYSPMHRHELEWICCLCGTVNELEARYGLSHPEITQPMVECILPFDR